MARSDSRLVRETHLRRCFSMAALRAFSSIFTPFFRVKLARVPLQKMRSMSSSSSRTLRKAARAFLPALQPLPSAWRVQTVILSSFAFFFESPWTAGPSSPFWATGFGAGPSWGTTGALYAIPAAATRRAP